MVNRGNLKTLADYLFELPENYDSFNMSSYFSVVEDGLWGREFEIRNKYARENGGVHNCGAVACAVGHGPSAGFLAVDSDFPGSTIDWSAYCERNFCPVFSEGSDAISSEFAWMFGGMWSHFDNTAKGAAERIYFFLDHGVPSGFSENCFHGNFLNHYKGYAK
jgi:hypothetical protein